MPIKKMIASEKAALQLGKHEKDLWLVVNKYMTQIPSKEGLAFPPLGVQLAN